MKQILSLSLLVISLVWVPGVLAHVLETDGSIGAVMHIDPQDDPVVGQPATFYFEFKDRENKFNPQNCNCRVQVYQAGQLMTDQSLVENGFGYIFPARNVYQIRVVGQATDQSFADFELNYDLRVERMDQVIESKPWWQANLGYLVMVLTVVLILAMVGWSKRKS